MSIAVAVSTAFGFVLLSFRFERTGVVAGLGKNERWLPAKNLRGDALAVSLRENLKEDERQRGRGGMACLGKLEG